MLFRSLELDIPILSRAELLAQLAQQHLELRPDSLEFPAVVREGLDELGDGHAQGHEQADDEGVDEDDDPDGGDGPGNVVARGQGHERAHGDDEREGEEGGSIVVR